MMGEYSGQIFNHCHENEGIRSEKTADFVRRTKCRSHMNKGGRDEKTMTREVELPLRHLSR